LPLNCCPPYFPPKATRFVSLLPVLLFIFFYIKSFYL
jgi:hypothetical protein